VHEYRAAPLPRASQLVVTASSPAVYQPRTCRQSLRIVWLRFAQLECTLLTADFDRSCSDFDFYGAVVEFAIASRTGFF
jgi:hypothetical protein